MIKCASCGMPLREGGGPYCQYCTASDGQLKPYEEVLAGMTAFLVRTQGMDAEAAGEMAREGLAQQPAWKTAP